MKIPEVNTEMFINLNDYCEIHFCSNLTSMKTSKVCGKLLNKCDINNENRNLPSENSEGPNIISGCVSTECQSFWSHPLDRNHAPFLSEK